MISNEEFRKACEERFEKWKRQFIESRATPQVVIGISLDKGEIIITTVEALNDYVLIGLIQAANRLVLARKVGRSMKCDNCLNIDAKRFINVGLVKVTLHKCHMGRWGYFASKLEREAAADTCGSQFPIYELFKGGKANESTGNKT